MPESRATVELVRVETVDGLFLNGSLQWPRSAGVTPVDAYLLIHGTGSNFYAPGVLESFAEQAVACGSTVLRVNTRGHDGICSIPSRRGSIQGGASHERIGDSTLDISAWLDWLVAGGFRRIVLVGHSMGGVKAIYSQANAQNPAVCAIIGISPPRFAHESLRTGPHGDLFCDEFSRASALVAAGHGDALLPVTQPLSYVATAAGYVEKYGPENRYDYVPLLSRLPCPVLILVGSESIETSAAFKGLSELLAGIANGQSRLTCEIVEGANINYTGCEAATYVRAEDWLKQSVQMQCS
jgi:pimeloyl-ACP methyl ester carboxylesterase